MMDVLFSIKGKIGHITLNRPKALNALTHSMLLNIETQLCDWKMDNAITAVVIDAAGDRAFCAGGDIVDLYTEGRSGHDQMARVFWRDEYRLNALIATYPKPFISFMDGIVMGGGVGISAHGSHRIVTEKTLFAMPECSIGLVPDVGGSLLLANMPGYCGEYVGLSGARLSGADCLYAGLADFYVLNKDLEALKNALFETGDVNTISDFISQMPQSELESTMGKIDAVFRGGNLTEIMRALDEDMQFVRDIKKRVSFGAPLALVSALKLIRSARDHKNLNEALRDEYRFVSMAVNKGEFIEGVRAAIIDKTRDPKWRYAKISDVPKTLIDALDIPAPDGDIEI